MWITHSISLSSPNPPFHTRPQPLTQEVFFLRGNPPHQRVNYLPECVTIGFCVVGVWSKILTWEVFVSLPLFHTQTLKSAQLSIKIQFLLNQPVFMCTPSLIAAWVLSALSLWARDLRNRSIDQTLSSVRQVIVPAFLIFHTADPNYPASPFSFLLFCNFILESIILFIFHKPNSYFDLYLL